MTLINADNKLNYIRKIRVEIREIRDLVEDKRSRIFGTTLSPVTFSAQDRVTQ